MLPQRLPDAEFEIMEYIWDATPPVTTSQAMESVGRAHGWKIQTLATLFKRLTERGFLRAERGTGRRTGVLPGDIARGISADGDGTLRRAIP